MRPPSSAAASRSATLIGRSASGVCASPSSFSAPRCAQPAVGVERHHHVGGREPFALEQLPDQPRRRQLARDVVLQVRVQAPVARVELGRGAHREHRGLQQVQPERVARPPAGARRRPSPSRPARAAARPRRRCRARGTDRRVGVRPRDPLDRRHHAAVDEAEGDRRVELSHADLVRHGVRLVLHGVARIRDGERPARRARRAAGRRARARARSACRRPTCSACTGPCAK